MDKKFIEQTLFRQLALDYNCNEEDFLKEQVLVTERKNIPGRRAYQPEPPELSLVTTGKTLVIMAGERYFKWAKEKFSQSSPEWIFEFPNLSEIEKKLNEHGQYIADAHEFYLPLLDYKSGNHPSHVGLKFYSQQEILQFKGMEDYNEAYAFKESCPDVVGVSASVKGEILSMAGASRDSENMWQIGINVSKKAVGKGFGTITVSALKDRVLSMGKVPFYGTAISHIASQNVARKAGFYPAWAELYTKKME